MSKILELLSILTLGVLASWVFLLLLALAMTILIVLPEVITKFGIPVIISLVVALVVLRSNDSYVKD